MVYFTGGISDENRLTRLSASLLHTRVQHFNGHVWTLFLYPPSLSVLTFKSGKGRVKGRLAKRTEESYWDVIPSKWHWLFLLSCLGSFVKLQSLGPGREWRICNGCGSKAWGEARVGESGRSNPEKTTPREKVLNCSSNWIQNIVFEVKQEISTMGQALIIDYYITIITIFWCFKAVFVTCLHVVTLHEHCF